MKISRFWKHFLASACIIGILASGLPAYAAASPAQATPEALELCNAAATPESVISLINQIGTVTRSRRPAIVAALNAYNQLDDASKAQGVRTRRYWSGWFPATYSARLPLSNSR